MTMTADAPPVTTGSIPPPPEGFTIASAPVKAAPTIPPPPEGFTIKPAATVGRVSSVAPDYTGNNETAASAKPAPEPHATQEDWIRSMGPDGVKPEGMKLTTTAEGKYAVVRDLNNPNLRAVHSPTDPDIDAKIVREARANDPHQQALPHQAVLYNYGVDKMTPEAKMKLANNLAAQNIRRESEKLAQDVSGGAAVNPVTPQGQQLLQQTASESPQSVGASILNAAAQPELALVSGGAGSSAREALANAAKQQHPVASFGGGILGNVGEPATGLAMLGTGGAIKPLVAPLTGSLLKIGISEAAAKAIAPRMLQAMGTAALGTGMAAKSAVEQGRAPTAGEVVTTVVSLALMGPLGEATGGLGGQDTGGA